MGLRIVGEETPFRDRQHAAELLVAALRDVAPEDPLVLAIPRGGVVIGARMASDLGGDLDVVVARKLGAPGNPELAIGAMTEAGEAFLNRSQISSLGVSERYLQDEQQRQAREIKERVARYRDVKKRVPREGRCVIVVDDGVATGATMKATLHGLRALNPDAIWCVFPVAPEDSLQGLTEAADEVVCLAAPHFFQAVGQFYERFTQVSDEEVLRLLEASSGPPADRDS